MNNTKAFLEKILPRSGIYFLAIPQEAPYTGFRHITCHTLEAMLSTIEQLNEQPKITLYHACASFRHEYIEQTNREGKLVKRRRIQDNALYARAFWLDIDCGPGKPYESQLDAVKALAVFCKATRLPKPTLVLSGNGVHVYWTFQQDVLANDWKHGAERIKRLTVVHGLKADHSRTSDISSVLRPVGTWHRKDKDNPKAVSMAHEGPDTDYSALLQIIDTALMDQGQLPPPPKHAKATLNSDLQAPHDPAFAEQIAARCQHIATMRDTKGAIEEPLWYAAIGVLRFCVEGEELIHEWSSGYPGYSATETSEKVAHHVASGVGPTTCAKFDSLTTKCKTCAVWGKITSPIQLGVKLPERKPIEIQYDGVVVTLPPPPKPWLRDEKKGLGKVDHESGAIDWFCPYDIVPIRRAYDVDMQQAAVTLRASYPKGADREFDIPASMIASKEFGKAMSGKELFMMDKDMKLTQSYMQSYLQEVQKLSTSTALHSHMGWKDDFSRFVVGTTEYKADGTTEASPASVDTSMVRGLTCAGDLETWKEIVDVYNRPNMEPYQFGLLTAFGAPLVPFSSETGAMISLISPRGGQGKTTIQRTVMSVWGDPRELGLLATDTVLAIMGRVAKYCHLPVVMDELTNQDGKWISSVAFQITQGRAKIGLRTDHTERHTTSRWGTLLLTSSNTSLVDKVTQLRAGSDAEANRVFEYLVINPGAVSKTEADVVFKKLNKNFGHAGAAYAKMLVQNRDKLAKLYEYFKNEIDSSVHATSAERIWVTACALNLAGGALAKKLGLVSYDMDAIAQWALIQFQRMRGTIVDNVRTNISILAMFLNENVNNRLVTQDDGSKGGSAVVLEAPRGGLRVRVVKQTSEMWIPIESLRLYFDQNGGNVSELKRELKSHGALLRAKQRHNLGVGTPFASISAECIVIKHDILASALGGAAPGILTAVK